MSAIVVSQLIIRFLNSRLLPTAKNAEKKTNNVVAGKIRLFIAVSLVLLSNH